MGPEKQIGILVRALARIALVFLFVAVLSESAAESPKPASDQRTASSDTGHWAFQPLRKITLPTPRDLSWARTPIDRFILSRLEANDLQPADSATREQLIRRVTFDLVGLPPTPDEIDAFLSDSDPNAYEKVVDRLLASPRHGERWGRHWLDLARFAESDGFEHDAVRPHAWRYRDYVIRSLNQNKSYAQFVREQIAGDKSNPGDRDSLIATAFNLLGPDMVDSSDQVQRRHNSLNDMTDTTGLVFLGLTVGCARCHDHKFEPISQTDYYSLQAFFTPAVFHRAYPIPTDEERAKFESEMKRYRAEEEKIRTEIREIEAPIRKRIRSEKLALLPNETRLAHSTVKTERTPEQVALVKQTEAGLKISNKEILERLPKIGRSKREALGEKLDKLSKPRPLPMTLAIEDGKTASDKTFVLNRGDYNQPTQEVSPGFPGVLKATKKGMLSGLREGTKPSAGSFHSADGGLADRSALANWIGSPENPLTARVMVNRIWQHHFGKGLVPTPSDFGTNGLPPTHPDLLDWLAGYFIRSGWSIKAMHKLILLSATYQQSSISSKTHLERDPGNRLYSRWPRMRLEGEVIRDSLLALSERLNFEMEGPGVFPPIPEDVFKGAKGWRSNADLESRARRSIYIFARRNLRFPFLEVFDAPDNNLSCAAREQSTSAPQSLTLLNSDDAMEAARAIARHVSEEASSPIDRITDAYRLILGRYPTTNEREMSRAFLENSPLSELCRALFNSNAFLYVD